MSFSRAGASSSNTNASNNNNSNNNIPRPPPPSTLRRGNAHANNNSNGNSTNATPRVENNNNNNNVAAAAASGGGSVSNRLLQPTASSSLRRAASNSLSNSNRRSSSNTARNNNNSNQNRRRGSATNSRNNSDNDDSEEYQQGPLWISINKPSALYTAPNGQQVGEAEIGTIIEEYASTTDIFGAEWIASVALNDDDDENNQAVGGGSEDHQFSYIWVRKYEKGESLQSPREALWKLKDEQDSSSTVAAAAPTPNNHNNNQNIICNPSHAPFRPPPFQSSSCDFSLILQYLELEEKKNIPSASRDWNTEYQVLIERLLFTKNQTEARSEEETEQENSSPASSRETQKIRLDIHKFYSEFAEEIGKIGVKIVEELSVSVNNRTVKPFVGSSGSIVLGTYFHNGIMYRMNVDSVSGAYGGDKNAMKIANQILKATNFVATAGPLFFFNQPLLMILTFRGFRITASTIPPLRPDGLLAGSMDSGKTWKQPNGFFNTLIEEFGEQLGLSSHKVTTTSSSSSYTTPLPYDSCIIGGYDQRFYTMNVGRFLPPIAPVKNYPSYSPPTIANLFWRLRPELVNRLDFHVSCDSFVPNASHVEDNEDAIAASSLLRDHAIPSVAAVLGFLEPTLAPTIVLEKCVSCKKENIQDHLVFTICESECCKICPQCYLQIQKVAFWDEKVQEAEEMVKGYIKKQCGSLPRTLKGFVMTPDISTIMHAHGVNLRYLNIVYQKIPRSSFHCTGHYVEIEMIARTAQTLLSEILRKSADNDDANQKTAQFFVSLLQPSGPQAEKFWAEELGPNITKQYNVTSPFDTERLDRDLVYKRLSELTGVQFSSQSVKSLLTEKPFVQMMPPQPVLKQVLLPNLVECCGDRRDYLAKYSGLLQVYWSELPESEAVKVLWQKKRPLHFKEDDEDE